jgi:hypothetical protein
VCVAGETDRESASRAFGVLLVCVAGETDRERVEGFRGIAGV